MRTLGYLLVVAMLVACQGNNYQYPVECQCLCTNRITAFGAVCNSQSVRDCLITCDDIFYYNRNRNCAMCKLGLTSSAPTVSWGAPSQVTPQQTDCPGGQCTVIGPAGAMCNYPQSQGTSGYNRCGLQLEGPVMQVDCASPSYNTEADCRSSCL